MPDADHTPVDGPADTDPAPPEPAHWHTYKLRKLGVSTSAINGKYCRVSEIGEGFHAIEVEGFEPVITEEPREVCQLIAEKSAHSSAMVRRFVAVDGSETYR